MKKILFLLMLLWCHGAWASFPTTSVLDTFNRANENPLNATNWHNSFALSNNLAVVSNACVIGNGGGYGAEYWQLNTFGPNVEVYATLSSVPTSGQYVSADILTQGANSGSTDSGYLLQALSGTTIKIIKLTNNSQSTLSTISQSQTSGDSFGMSSVGGVITAWYKVGAGAWTNIGSVNDSTFSSSTSNINLEFSGTTGNPTVTNFGGGTSTSSSSNSNTFFGDTF